VAPCIRVYRIPLAYQDRGFCTFGLSIDITVVCRAPGPVRVVTPGKPWNTLCQRKLFFYASRPYLERRGRLQVGQSPLEGTRAQPAQDDLQ